MNDKLKKKMSFTNVMHRKSKPTIQKMRGFIKMVVK